MAGNPLTDPNWASNVTDTIVDTVDKVRDRTTKPLVMLARGLVFGLLTVFLAAFVVVAVLIGASRGLIAALEWPFDHDTSVWISYFVLGGLLCLAGAVAMSRRESKDAV